MSELTTAASLNMFRSELQDGGYPEEAINELAMIALSNMSRGVDLVVTTSSVDPLAHLTAKVVSA